MKQDKNNGNWIRLNRNFIEWKYYSDPFLKSVYLHCLLKAYWITTTANNIKVEKGSFTTNLRALSKELGLSIPTIRKHLMTLEDNNDIKITKYARFTKITIVNFEKYQTVFLTEKDFDNDKNLLIS